MDPNLFLKVCVIFSILGVLALFVMIESFELANIEIEELAEADEGELVRIRGSIIEAEHRDTFSIFEIGVRRSVKVVAFDDGQTSLKPGQLVRVDGRVHEFRGKKELIADEIVILS